MRRLVAAPVFAVALLGTAAPAVAVKEPVRLWEEAYVRVRHGATVQARFHLSVEPGYFVVATGIHGSARLHPLALRMKPVKEVQLGRPAYPAPTATASIAGLPEFPAYEGVVAVSLPVTVPDKAAWTTRKLEGVLEYQACTATGCREPATLPIAIELEIRREAEGQTGEESRAPPR